MSGTVWQRSDEWIGTEVEDSFVMVNIETGKYVSLNPTANAVWRALEHSQDEDQLCRMLMGEFDVGPEECRRAIANILERMGALNLARQH